MWPCIGCEELALHLWKEHDMQTSGTFPQLNKSDSVTRPTPKKPAKKR
jgi:hypothetical protein